MKQLLKIFVFVLVACCLFGCQKTEQVEMPQYETAQVAIDGQVQSTQFAPMLKDGQALVTLGDATVLFDAEFKYNAEEKIITAANEDYYIELTVDSNKAKGTRKSYDIEVCPQIVGNQVMVPVSFAAEQLGYGYAWDDATKTANVTNLNLKRDEPQNQYQAWAIARAKLLTDITFTPLKDIPKLGGGVFEAGKEVRGVPYSSVETNDKFVGDNVLMETFMSALANPDSVLYTKDIRQANKGAAYYGTVCNSLVRFALGMPTRCHTVAFREIPGMNEIALYQEYTVDDLQLCDVLQYPGHVALVTGILRDETGKIVKVEISESTTPTCKRRLWTVEEFYETWTWKYSILRYEHLDQMPPFDESDTKLVFESGLDKKSPMIAVDYGNKANYLAGEETVISSFAEGKNTVQIIRDDVLIEEIQVNGYEKLTRTLEKGYYVVKLKDTEHFTEFCVCQPEVSHTIEDGIISIHAQSGDPDSKLIGMDYRGFGVNVSAIVQLVQLSEEELATGNIVQKYPTTAGTYKIYFKNKYGTWVTPLLRISETAD